MEPKFICHPDFADIAPVNVFHKEMDNTVPEPTPPELQNRHILFRKKAVLKKSGKAVLKITADDYYKLYINGVFVTQGPAASYPHCYNYNEVDVTGYLREGENTFAVHTYHQGLVNRVWVSGDRREMFWFDLSLDGERVLVSDESWLCADHTAYSSAGIIGYETQFLEQYDSAAPEVGFESCCFDDSLWSNAAVFRHADYTLRKQATPQLVFSETAPAKTEPIPGGVRIDFGFEAVGYLTAKAKGKKGDTVLIRLGEELNEDGSVRFEMRCNCRYEDRWVLSGKEDVLDQFDYKAFRYAELLFPEGTEISDIRFVIRHYPFEQKRDYPTDDPDLQKIFKLCADSIRYGSQENFMDCPTREKGQYLNDITVTGRSHAVLTGDTSLYKKALRDFADSAFICPGLMTVSGGSLMQEIADASLQFPAMVLWVYAMDGDRDFLEEMEPAITGIYWHFLKKLNADGLPENVTDKWNLVDWPENLRDGYDFPLTRPIGTGVHNVLCAFWCGFLDALDEYYQLLGMPPTGRTERTKAAFIRTFYNEATGLFCDSPALTHSAVHSNILPLLFHIGTEDEALKRRLIDFIAKKKLTSSGVYMAYFALAALVREGERELAGKLVLDPGCWLNMLAEGATTVYEAWGKDQKWNTSLFHPWATAPLIVFADGVRPY